MNMKFKFNKKLVAIAAANLICLCGAAGFYAQGRAAADSQSFNFAAERWGEDYCQISSFMSEDSGFNTDLVGSVRSQILYTMQTVSIAAEDGKKLCPDAYSANVGQAEITSPRGGYSSAEITAVGGDFFLIHNFRLLDGAFFSDDDIMQDGAVINESLAWSLYGSSEVSGMKISINGVQFYISGVIEDPPTKAEKSCAGELPIAYVSYSGASGMADTDEEPSADFKTVTCYECIMPDPVEGYAYSSMKDYLKSFGDDTVVVCNTGRFEPVKRLKALKNLRKLAIKNSSVEYPYWENASRLVEYDLSFIYRRSLLCLIIPFITLGWLCVKLVRIGIRKFRSARTFIAAKADRIVNDHRRKKYEKNI